LKFYFIKKNPDKNNKNKKIIIKKIIKNNYIIHLSSF